MTTRLDNPFPYFMDAEGQPLHNGFISMGVAGQDPETHPLATYWDAALTVAAEQPLRTRGGYIVDGANPAFVYAAEGDYSLRVRDASGGELLFLSSIAVSGSLFQPLNSNLTAISDLLTTRFGRALLTLANQAALKAATGIPDPLPLSGGNVTGPIGRQGAGGHLFFDDAALTVSRIFVRNPADADPTTSVGQLVFRRVAP